MCRWLAYSGPPLQLSRVLTKPDHSLIVQSHHSLSPGTTNGDGFGIGWYGRERSAGCYRDTYPAWNDANLRHLAAHLRSPLFFAHVRAASGTSVQRTNCHPFAFENWLFQHNGMVPQFKKLKRQLVLDVDPELYPHIEGSTDSELLFFLALTLGLREDPQPALERMIGHVERMRQKAGIQQPISFSAAASDGQRLLAVRYSSNGASPTLFHSCHVHSLRTIHGSYESLPPKAVILVSEPLDELAEHWQAIPESSFVLVQSGEVSLTPFSIDTNA